MTSRMSSLKAYFVFLMTVDIVTEISIVVFENISLTKLSQESTDKIFE